MIEPNYTYRAKVLAVIDGDTIDVDLDVGFHMRARLRLRIARIDTPEMNSKDQTERDRAREAKTFVVTAIAGKDVVLQTKKTDLYGRYLAEVFYAWGGEQRNLSDDLLSEGLAKLYT